MPKSIADKHSIKEGSEMNMYADDNMITLETVKTIYTLDELVSQITDENRHSSVIKARSVKLKVTLSSNDDLQVIIEACLAKIKTLVN
ncbi:hypothetical protein ACIQYS_11255 [Psychrobacillus sp. NPDC096426]|uniref:AbrB/MazE/SpoVT family DNA-binding domain-containing protein n=1 Tax=Psychrobacillus sp. NPDC096426 TaxID=3364491 RepID=UPI0037F9E765